ncbi:HalOD1 output domain-containing protein [Halobaculum sp. EA56]|uniref:HalOD1 output domain-containing protein n=1 Tax=Halobaculum sp. EA56 TaxID=3421648 RepID=UPI003EB81EFF
MPPDPPDSVTVSYDEDTGEYTATFDPEAVPPSVAVVETTAEIRATEPRRYAPLFEVVDPDALDRICSPTAAGDDDTAVEFTYLAHRVRVRSDGYIAVTPKE